MEADAQKGRVRAGSGALSIFGYSLTAKALRAHADGPLRWSDLSDTVGWAPQTSLRLAVANLCELGVLAKLRLAAGTTEIGGTEITPAGQDLLAVADRLEQWLQRAPSGPIPLDSAAAIGAIRALTGGWNATIVRKLVEKSMTLTELNAEIDDLPYPTLERRLARLRSTQLVARMEGDGRGKPYVVSDWLRHAIAPLSASARWERSHRPVLAQAISPVEVEAAFLLTLPLVQLSKDASGDCALAVLTSAGSGREGGGREDERDVAGVTLGVHRGEIVYCKPTAAAKPTTWGLGTPDGWLEAMIDGRSDALRIRGVNPGLPLHIAQEIHNVVFPPLATADLHV